MLIRLRDSLGLELVAQTQASHLRIVKPGGLVFLVTIPHEVLEWFVDARDDSGAIWSDWADYYRVEGETDKQLLANMSGDIERFATALAKSPVRLAMRDQAKKIEWERAGAWQEISQIL